MPRLYPDVVSPMLSSDDEDPLLRSLSVSVNSIEELEDSNSTTNQESNKEDFGGYDEDMADEPEPGVELLESVLQPVSNEENYSTSNRKAFAKLLQSIESPHDIQLLYPRSLSSSNQYKNYDERKVLREFVKLESSKPDYNQMGSGDLDFEEFEVTDFVIYRNIDHSKGFGGQLEYLHNVASRGDAEYFSLDGLICCEGELRRVVGLQILDVNIGALEDSSIHTTVKHIWIQTHVSCEENETWYRLSNPAREYQSYWKCSIWVCDFSKHILDYLCESSKKNILVRLAEFSHSFWEQIKIWHGYAVAFKHWHNSCGGETDFRKLLIRHGQFCWDQTYSLHKQDDFELILDHLVWDELALAGRYDQKWISKYERTTVTEDVAAIFQESFPAWGPKKYNLLSPTRMSLDVAAARRDRIASLRMSDGRPSHNTHQPPTDGQRLRKVSKVELIMEKYRTADQSTPLAAAKLAGKVVLVRVNARATSGQVQSEEKQFQFAWISETLSQKKVHAIWLSLPSEAICGYPNSAKTFYPIGNELFFTESCEVITLSKVVGVFDVATLGCDPKTADTILLRQIYKEHEDIFVTATTDSFLCTCREVRPKTQKELYPERTAQFGDQEVCKMRNLSLFSGAGILDFALKESGTFETIIAVDHSEKAIRSHAANTSDETCEHVIDSVNSVLKRYLRGEEKLPRLHCVTAGCPCQGFSRANKHKYNINGQRNCSMLANTLSWIDLVRPEYAIIENVPSMDINPGKRGIANACRQAIACLVAMGYQVRKMELEGSKYGNSTMRRRLYLVAAAPGYALPEVPAPTHGPGLKPIQTIGELFSPLPSVHNDTQVNLMHPDHLPIERLKQYFSLKWDPDSSIRVSLRSVVKHIPKVAGMGLVQAYEQGHLSAKQEQWYRAACSLEQKQKNSQSLRRIPAGGLLPTIVTVISPMCARIGGHIIHYDEDRTVTLEELRLAQGLPDWFLLVGNIREQVELIGNGNAWQMAAALGRSLSIAWTISIQEGRLYIQQAKGHEATSLPVEKGTSQHTSSSRSQRGSTDTLGRVNDHGNQPPAIVGSNTPETRTNLGDDTALDPGAVWLPTPLIRHVAFRVKEEDEDDDPNGTSRRSTPSIHKSRASTSIPFNIVEELVISDRESLDFHSDGTMKYRQNQRSNYPGTTKTAPHQPKITVEIPPKKKRAPPPMEDDTDDEIIYMRTKPVAQTPLMKRRKKW